MKNVTIPFCKMHGLGNDFVIINATLNPIDINQLAISQLADRHRGIGFDQMLVIEPSKQAHFFCRIFNADGSEAEQCGNGLRCVARFIHEERLHPESSLQLETKAGIFPLFIENYHTIRILMGTPDIKQKNAELKLKNDTILSATILALGNPHAIVKVESIDGHALHSFAHEIARHSFFSQGINVGLMEVLNQHQIRLRTFERGVGETFACGSNACAAVAAGIINGWLDSSVEVQFRYGNLWVEWQGDQHPINLIGPASRVFSGIIEVKT